jgi:hypothetical protein
MAQIKKMLILICSVGLVLLSSCKNSKNEPIVNEEPTLEEIHAKGAKTLNEILLEHEKSIQGEGEVSEAPQAKKSLRGYGPVQWATYYGFTHDYYLAGKPQMCYLNVDLYHGYYFVEVHSVILEVKAKPFTEYEQVDSPKCGYIPTTYTDPSLTMPNGFNNPIRGCFNDGYKPGGRQYFRTYYIKVAYSLSGQQINRTLPDFPKNFEWNVAYREAE